MQGLNEYTMIYFSKWKQYNKSCILVYNLDYLKYVIWRSFVLSTNMKEISHKISDRNM